jgi:putative endonuclease
MRPALFISVLRFSCGLLWVNGLTGGTLVRWGQQASEGAVIPPPVAAFVYLLRCADGSLYCGWSTDPERRLRQHQAGTASRYTRTRRPVELVYRREFATRSEAMREEVRIKRLSPSEKRRLARPAARAS